METELKDRAVLAQHGGVPAGDIKQGQYAQAPQGMAYQPGGVPMGDNKQGQQPMYAPPPQGQAYQHGQ